MFPSEKMRCVCEAVGGMVLKLKRDSFHFWALQILNFYCHEVEQLIKRVGV